MPFFETAQECQKRYTLAWLDEYMARFRSAREDDDRKSARLYLDCAKRVIKDYREAKKEKPQTGTV